MLKGRDYVCQHLGDPIFVDVVGLGGSGPTWHRYLL